MYKLKRFEKDGIKRYDFDSYEDAEKWVNDEVEKFKKTNKVIDENKDKSFIRFKLELEDWLKYMQNDDYEKCNRCLESDHEGNFCRCENRNIRIAKLKRERNENESPWKKTCVDKI